MGCGVGSALKAKSNTKTALIPYSQHSARVRLLVVAKVHQNFWEPTGTTAKPIWGSGANTKSRTAQHPPPPSFPHSHPQTPATCTYTHTAISPASCSAHLWWGFQGEATDIGGLPSRSPPPPCAILSNALNKKCLTALHIFVCVTESEPPKYSCTAPKPVPIVTMRATLATLSRRERPALLPSCYLREA